MIYNIIATGSAGNAVLLGGGKILIDCGVSYKLLEPYIKDIQVVLLTHIHSDHFRPSTIRRLAKERPTLRWCCCDWLVPNLSKLVDKRRIDIAKPGFCLVYTGFCTVKPEHASHDVPNCGWHIWRGNEAAFYITDTASMDGISAKNYDLYMIEANHGEEEIVERMEDKISRGEYSYEMRAAHTHLSEEKALDWIYQNIGPNGEYVFLHGHVDKEKKDA